jgi:hypothetical protein
MHHALVENLMTTESNENDATKIHEILSREIREVLTELSRDD